MAFFSPASTGPWIPPFPEVALLIWPAVPRDAKDSSHRIIISAAIMIAGRRVAHLAAEIDANAEAFDEYAAELTLVAWDLMDNESWHDCPDWDWQWPAHRTPAFARRAWEGTVHAGALPATVISAVRAAYEALDDVPPSLSSWAPDWDRNEMHFLVFLLARIEAFRVKGAAAFAAAEKALRSSAG
jgi:hypothetical protein